MRAMIAAAALFLYVCTDITVNHGASVRGWVSLFSTVVRSVTQLG